MYTREAFLILGRFQGYTKKHEELIWMAKGDVDCAWGMWHPPEVMVGIVCGAKTSDDKEKNPFDFPTRVWMIKQCHPELKCLKLSTAYLGDAIEIFYGLGYDLKRLYVGGDREVTYQKQVERYKYNIEIRVLVRDAPISGTRVRDALSRGDQKAFEKNSPVQLHRHYEEIKLKYDIGMAFGKGPLEE